MTGGNTPTPAVSVLGDSYVVCWAGGTAEASEIVMEFSRITEHRDSLSAELSVTNAFRCLHWSRINMASASGRTAVIKALEESPHALPWRQMLDAACQRVAWTLRQGSPAVPLVPTRPSPDRYLVPLYIPLKETTVLFGAGGSAKSLLCLALGVAGILQQPLSSVWAVGKIERVLYCDWETEADTHHGRLYGLTVHREQVPEGRILHRRMRRPLTDSIVDLRNEVARCGIDLVVVDSLALAAGPEPEGTDASVRTLEALGTLPVTKIVVAHIPKVSVDQKRPEAFGSIFIRNIPRSQIFIQREETLGEQDQINVSLIHRKNNNGPEAPPSALTFTFDDTDDSIYIKRSEPSLEGASAARQILGELEHGSRTATDIAEATGLTVANVKKTAQRLEKSGQVVRIGSAGGRGNEQEWGRSTPRQTGT